MQQNEVLERLTVEQQATQLYSDKQEYNIQGEIADGQEEVLPLKKEQ